MLQETHASITHGQAHVADVGPPSCPWELSLYPEGNGTTRGTHIGLFLDVVKSEAERQRGAAWSRPILSFKLSILRRSAAAAGGGGGGASGGGALVVKERTPNNGQGYGAGFSHPRSWGWAAMIAMARLGEALGPDDTLVVMGEVAWQQRAELSSLLDAASEPRRHDLPDCGDLLFSDWLSDVKFVVDVQPAAQQQILGCDGGDGGDLVATHGLDDDGGGDDDEQQEEEEERDVYGGLAGSAGSDMEDGDTATARVSAGAAVSDQLGSARAAEAQTAEAQTAAARGSVAVAAAQGDEVDDGPSDSDMVEHSNSSSTTSLPTAAHLASTSSLATTASMAESAAGAAVFGKAKRRTETITIPAHRAILASRSDYFAAMFRSVCAEGSNSTLTGTCPLPPCTIVQVVDFTPSDVRYMLEYIYRGKLARIPEHYAERAQLIRLADRYQLPGLHSYMGALIMDKDVTEETCLDVLELAQMYSSVSLNLKTACLGFVRENIAKLKDRPYFKEWVRSTEQRDLIVDLLSLM
ncbi:hypothetical protein BC831DRAFT_454176 [Entophlyctis helioformis]|nr:hypothetical protein BC831DRAFT_454176 [Entophlyctis helioformis]